MAKKAVRYAVFSLSAKNTHRFSVKKKKQKPLSIEVMEFD